MFSPLPLSSLYPLSPSAAVRGGAVCAQSTPNEHPEYTHCTPTPGRFMGLGDVGQILDRQTVNLGIGEICGQVVQFAIRHPKSAMPLMSHA